MNAFKYKIVLFFVGFILISCNKEKNLAIDVSKIKTNIKVVAFNDEFYNSKNTLVSLKKKHSLLFDDTEDNVWEQKRKNTVELAIQKEIKKKYGNYGNLKESLRLLFKHIKYYYPQIKEPKVYLYSSNLEDFNDPITYVNDERGNFLFISIDCFLTNSKFYNSFPVYIKERMTMDTMIPLVCEKIAETIVPKNLKNSNFLSLIILQGKKLILADAFLPNLEDYTKILYSQKEMNWSLANEKNIWNYFIAQNYLYSPEQKLSQRFIDIAPFSKFYTDIDVESPGSIGIWIGWRIAKAYLNNNDVSLQEFISIDDANVILKNSRYNP